MSKQEILKQDMLNLIFSKSIKFCNILMIIYELCIILSSFYAITMGAYFAIGYSALAYTLNFSILSFNLLKIVLISMFLYLYNKDLHSDMNVFFNKIKRLLLIGFSYAYIKNIVLIIFAFLDNFQEYKVRKAYINVSIVNLILLILVQLILYLLIKFSVYVLFVGDAYKQHPVIIFLFAVSFIAIIYKFRFEHAVDTFTDIFLLIAYIVATVIFIMVMVYFYKCTELYKKSLFLMEN